MSKFKEAWFSSHTARKDTSVYDLNLNDGKFEEDRNEIIGVFKRKTNEKIDCLDTPRVGLSPFIRCETVTRFHIYILDRTLLTLEVWECSSSDSDYDCKHCGILHVADLEKNSALIIENSGENLSKVIGNVTCTCLYVSSPEVSVIKCVKLPIFNEYADSSQILSVTRIKSETLKRPMALAVSRKEERTLLAAISGLCGKIFLFEKVESKSFQLLLILGSCPQNLLSPKSTLCFDSFLNIWASDYQTSRLLCYINNGPVEVTTFSTDDETRSLSSLEDGSLLVWSAKSSRVEVVSKVQNEKLSLKTILGPCKVCKPFDVKASRDARLMLVAGRDSDTNYPVVTLFRF